MNRNSIKRVLALLLLAVAMMGCSSVSQSASTKNAAENIKSFEIVTFHLSGMRFTTEYEIVMKGKDAEITQYDLRYEKDKGHIRVPKSKKVCSADRILKLLNDCELISWDGFHGDHPKDVKDGIMFSLKATVNGNRNIRAEGSENFPKHFRELWKGMDAILRDQKQ